MKKMIRAVAAAILVLSLAGCGSNVNETNDLIETEPVQTAEPAQPATKPETEEMSADADETDTAGSDVLVLYFSRTGEQYTVGVIDKGNTAIVAEMIADKTGGDLFEVLPKEDYYPYTYDELTDVAKQEQNDNARPEYRDEIPDLSRYDTVFIGAPVWWGDWPMIMYTIFENNDFAGKKLIPFATHEGSGLAGFDEKLASACPECTVAEGLAIRGNDAQNDQDKVRESVDDWISGLGY